MRPPHLRRLQPSARDVLLAASLTLLALIPHVLGLTTRLFPDFTYRPLDLAGIALILAQTVPLAWRRRSPWPVFLFIHTAALLHSGLNYAPSLAPTAVLIMFFTVTTVSGARRIAAATVIVVAGIALVVAVAPDQLPLGAPVVLLVFYCFLLVLSGTTRRLRAHAALIEERAALRERDREHQARQAATDERHRIARELHDVVAHHLSVIVIQARAARLGDRAGNLTAIEGAGREALEELRRLLDVLGADALEARPLSPEPGLDELPSLVERVSASGLPTRLHVEGSRRPLTSELDRGVYRVVQESLTNALKHAGPASAQVRVRFDNRSLEISVSDDGASVPSQVTELGRGLLGMRERVTLLGGQLQAGPAPDGGFRVHATLPLEEVADEHPRVAL